MYQEHFGLKKQPFPALAQGPDVFVGPRSAAAMKAIKNALQAEDAVVSISGPAGSGKSAVGRRALDGVGQARILVTIARIQLANDEVLELLLAGLGARQLPKSTVQRFAAFRRLLQQYAEQQKRVVIVVEDATRLGADALSELEALTAEDAGVSNGANIVLMGDARLAELMRDPKLARLKQRVRLRQAIEPLGEAELHGYLKHCFRLAGKDFDALFEPDGAQTLYSLCDGIPRMANKIIEAALASAAESGEQKVASALLSRIANEEFGLTGQHRVAAIEELVAANDASDKPVIEAVEDPPAVDSAAPAPAAVTPDEKPTIQEPPQADRLPDLEVAVAEEHETAEPAPVADDPADEIPELIQDTLPDLEVLAPEMAKAAETSQDVPVEAAIEAEPAGELTAAIASEAAGEDTEDDSAEDTITELSVLPELTQDDEDDGDDLPTLYSSGKMAAPAAETAPDPAPESAAPAVAAATDLATPELTASTEPATDVASNEPDNSKVSAEEPAPSAPAEEVPAWDRDPTLAELKPDLDALERAMAVAQGTEPEVAVEKAAPPPAPEPPAEPEIVPEITLDREIQAKIDEATEALAQTQCDALDVEGGADADAAEAAPASKRQSLKDTTELKAIASGLANARTIEDVDDKLAETLFGEELNLIAAEVIANAPPGYSANDDSDDSEPQAAAVPPAPDLEGANALSLEAEPEPEPSDPHGNIDNSPSQRLETLRALNATGAPPGAPPTPDTAESIVMAEDVAPAAPPPEDQPDSIEAQMDTSMTATLKALSVRPEDIPNDDDDTKKKKGFFSRFRKS